MKMKIVLFAVAGLLLASVAPLHADNMDEAKKIYEDKQDAVIWITGVAKISYSASGKAAEGRPDMPDRQVPVMSLGTIVSSDGLVVTVLSQLDPSYQVRERTRRTKNGDITVKATMKGISELKAVMPDGTEIPSELVMEDKNLDLAIVRIKTSSKEANGEVFQAVDLKNSAKGHILDEVVTLSRMPEIFYRVPCITRGHITMITRRPSLFLRAEGAAGGCPTFNMDGELVGIASAHRNSGRVVETTIIPAAYIRGVVQQSKKKLAGTETQAKPETGTEAQGKSEAGTETQGKAEEK
jgi:S1-C subfamily serine protease